MIVSKEIQLKGSFRFDTQFTPGRRPDRPARIDVAPLPGDRPPIAAARKVFEPASDKSMKVQIAFD
ncbi:hypothetical protein [Mesorhizobium sp. NFR06]|uniref:hypothetical protein n=1 Tax=Mesorhizobium sp. NFR06 TaxID=1566290 RepID=UPI00122DC49C|nr:hypothetical protein [Mesorhizobium sp. NFR06]